MKQMVRKYVDENNCVCECPITVTPKRKGQKKAGRRLIFKKKNMNTFHKYLHEMNKDMNDGMQLSIRTKDAMNRFMHDIFIRIAEGAQTLVRVNRRKTLLAVDIQTAMRLVFPSGLYEQSNHQARLAFEKLRQSYAPSRAMQKTTSGAASEDDECHCDVKYACKMYCDTQRAV